MKNVKKMLYSILAIAFASIILIKNVVYAVVVEYSYSPLYYISIIVVIAIVIVISILILRKIYKDNQLENENNEKKGVKK